MSTESSDAVWLSVLPDMSKFGPGMMKGSGKAADQAGAAAGKKFGLAALAGVAVVAGGAALAAKAVYNLGSTFDDMADTIQVGTGATGDVLDGLVADAKAIGTQVPATFDDISESVAAFNTFTGASGKPLQELAASTLEASRMLGEDGVANSEKFGKAMQQWQIPAEEGPGKLDALYKATQDYGVGLGEITGHLTTYGSVLQNGGFTMEESAALFGQLESGGIAVSRVMPGLNKSFRNWAAEGKNSKEELDKTVESIKNAETGTEALTIATETFGAEGAQRMTTAIRNGSIELGELSTALGDADGSIAASSAETQSFAEQWDIFKNKIMVAVAPVAEGLFDIVSEGMTWINNNAIPWIKQMAKAWENGTGPMGHVKDVFGTIVDIVKKYVIPYIKTLAGIVADTLGPILKDMVRIFTNSVLPILQDFWSFLQKNVIPVVSTLATKIVVPMFKLIGSAIKLMWTIVKPVLEALYWIIKNVLGPVFSWLWKNIVAPVMEGIASVIGGTADNIGGIFDKVAGWIEKLGDGFKSFGDGVAGVWHSLQEAIKKPVNFIINTIWNDGLRKALNLIPGVDLKRATPIGNVAAAAPTAKAGGRNISAFKDGGYVDLPWDSNNRDPYFGQTPGGGLFRFEGEEFIFPKAMTDKHRDSFEAMLRGDLPVPTYAGGGRVKPVASGIRGNTYAKHTGLDFPMPHGAPVRATADGTITRNWWAGANSYGRAIDQAIAGGMKARYAHLSSTRVRVGQPVTAGQIIGGVGSTGNSTGNHLHFEAGYRLGSYSTVGSTRAWLAGAKMLGGGANQGAGSGEADPTIGKRGVNLLTEIPKIFTTVSDGIKKSLTDPWSTEVLLPGVKDAMKSASAFVYDKVPGLKQIVEFGKSIWGFISGKKKKEDDAIQPFLTGGLARPGMASLSENGLPELVVGPQSRRMAGGERIHSAAATRRLMGDDGSLRMVRGTLSLAEDGTAYISGVAEAVYDDREAGEARWNRMGSK